MEFVTRQGDYRDDAAGPLDRGGSARALAATDVWLVHSGYRKYRRALLARGVKLYELKPFAQPNPALKGKLGSSRASLHVKTLVLDRGAVFVGSVNLDPRSLAQKTEVGVLVQCPALAREAAERFERWTAPALSYAVALVPEPQGSRLRWTGLDGGRIAEFFSEPGASLWCRLGAVIFSRLPIEVSALGLVDSSDRQRHRRQSRLRRIVGGPFPLGPHSRGSYITS